ncbi:MAG: hypothetical protein K0S78_4147, partial [Thermomicrobiales bacterium]|nr:hypothetical protein [Thermomicrobiales bacterium]
DMAATLAHELAHAVTHDACSGMPRDVREFVAASVAYAGCSQFGLDLSLRSVDDDAGWLDDQEAFRVGMAAIHDAAASRIDAIELPSKILSRAPHPRPTVVIRPNTALSEARVTFRSTRSRIALLMRHDFLARPASRHASGTHVEPC